MSDFERVFGEQERKNDLFSGQISDTTDRVLQYLETQLLMLSDSEQDFVQGCRLTLDTGGLLTAANQSEIHRIAKNLTYAGHNVVGGLAEGALSIPRVLKDLAGSIHMLTQPEQQFLQQMVGKQQTGQKLSVQEIEALIKIYGEKGF